MFGKIKKFGKAVYRTIDKGVGGLLPGGVDPLSKDTFIRQGFDAVVPDAVQDILRDPLGRDFSADQAEAARDHATAERLAAQEFNSAEALAAREFNAAEAEKSRQHSLMLAQTEYQRKVDSMRDAGLNPVLAAGGWGSGSQVPTSAQAQGAAAHSSPGSSPSASSSPMAPLQALLLAAQVRDISSAAKLKEEQARDLALTRDPRVDEMKSRVDLVGAQIRDLNASAEQKQAMTKNINEELKILEQKLRSATAEAEIDEAVADFETGIGGMIGRWTDAAGFKGRDLANLAGAIIGIGKFAGLLKKLGGKRKGWNKNYDRILNPETGEIYEIKIPELGR